MKWRTERGVSFRSEEQDRPDSSAEVFFNPKMQLNRDISILSALELAGKESTVMDSFAASGIRALRYSDEGFQRVIANDIDDKAISAMQKACQKNGLEVEGTQMKASEAMLNFSNQVDCLDVDPFGSFIEYMDACAECLRHGSMAGFTATDLGPVAGSYPKVASRRYASDTIKNGFMHETGLRIYIKEIFRGFARHNMSFKPQIAFRRGHYSRVIGTVFESKKGANRQLSNIGYLRYCHECCRRLFVESPFSGPDSCQGCGTDLDVAGPLWIGKLGGPGALEGVAQRAERRGWENVADLASKLSAESDIITPYYDLHEISSSMGTASPKTQMVIDELESVGYLCSATHFSDTGVRTEAPLEDIKDVIERL